MVVMLVIDLVMTHAGDGGAGGGVGGAGGGVGGDGGGGGEGGFGLLLRLLPDSTCGDKKRSCADAVTTQRAKRSRAIVL
jgi:hypothetical protein